MAGATRLDFFMQISPERNHIVLIYIFKDLILSLKGRVTEREREGGSAQLE